MGPEFFLCGGSEVLEKIEYSKTCVWWTPKGLIKSVIYRLMSFKQRFIYAWNANSGLSEVSFIYRLSFKLRCPLWKVFLYCWHLSVSDLGWSTLEITNFYINGVKTSQVHKVWHSQAGDSDSSWQLVSHFWFPKGLGMSTVTLYSLCHSHSASVLLYFTFT